MAGRHEPADWSAAGVRAFLAGYCRRPRDLAVSELTGGMENRNLLVEADGERLVLRRYDATPPEETPWELALLRFLTDRGFPTARLVEKVDAALAGTLGGKPAALFSFVAGQHPSPDTPGMAEQAAAVIARLHAVTGGLTLPYPRSRMDSRQRLARFLDWLAERDHWRQEQALARFAAQVEEYAAAFAARLAPHAATLPHGVVHNDAHAGNLLCDDAGRLVALLDFDDAHETYLLADVAMLLDVWATDRASHRVMSARTTEVLRAYARHRQLCSAEWDLLPDFLALYSLADATSYVSSRVQRGVSADRVLADCNQYGRYLERTAMPDWRDQLRAALNVQ
jgi:homoserine kinase type II